MVYPTQQEEERYIQRLLERDKEYEKKLEELYTRSQRDAQDRIDLFIARNITSDELNIAEARRPATIPQIEMLRADIRSTAYEYLTEEQRNTILHSLNRPRLTRLQLLEDHIYYNTSRLQTEQTPFLEQFLQDTFQEEYLRQHANIGFTPTAEQMDNIANTIIHQSYKGADWNSRLSAHSNALRHTLFNHVESTLMSGQHPTKGIQALAKEIEKSYTGKKTMSSLNHAKMLAITESGRVQTATQKYSYEKYDINEYEFIGEPDACSRCKKLIGKTFKVVDMEHEINANPIHPRCRCSTIPKISRGDWEDRMQERGL